MLRNLLPLITLITSLSAADYAITVDGTNQEISENRYDISFFKKILSSPYHYTSSRGMNVQLTWESHETITNQAIDEARKMMVHALLLGYRSCNSYEEQNFLAQ